MSSTRPTSPRPANRLITQASPYLLQHAHNPVDWFPWGEDAFAEARRRDVPLFVSIGYSTCYWCHVMERECFESDLIAAELNRHFVCVKVDREERPDLDDLCMNALLLIRGQGGWPLNIFLEPARLRPFWAGTYLPPEPRHGAPSIHQVIDGISHAWSTQRESVLSQADAIERALAERLAAAPPRARVGARHVTDAVGLLLRTLDATHGGFGSAPKFPQPCFLDLLLDVRDAADDSTRAAIDHALRLTLDQMMLGGIHDHLAGGFHRYSVDASWTVPHFEKMLYDNAQLARVYARAAVAFTDTEYADAARRACDHVLRDMLDPRGMFCSALDAEVDAREGLSYLWTPDELRAALSNADGDDLAFAIDTFGVAAGPNFQDPHHPDEPARSVLRLAARVRFADRVRLDRIRAVLLAARDARPQPSLDDKTITAWNGLMIGALADCGTLLAEPRLTAAASRAADAMLRLHRQADGTLVRSSRAGAVGPAAVLEDHAMLAWGLVRLAATTGEPRWSRAATDIINRAFDIFADADGTLFDTAADQPDLFLRARSTHDGAMPSGQSVMLHALLDLHERDDVHGPRADLLSRARAVLSSLAGAISDSPVGVANATRALFRVLRDRSLRDACAQTLDDATTTDAATDSAPDFTPVEVYASLERIALAADTPAELSLLVRIAPGYHIVAADPESTSDLTPLRVHRLHGGGFEVYADYPPGEIFRPSPAVAPVRVLRGEFELRVAIERTGEWLGTPLLGVTFHACRDDACLRPQTLELDVAIDPA